MTSTAAPVRDNSTHSIRVQWRNTRDAAPGEIASAIEYAPAFGYTVYQWEDTDKDGTRVTLTRAVNSNGRTVDLYATYYFTRVPCTAYARSGGHPYTCPSWASAYIGLTLDTDGTEEVIAACGMHTRDVERAYIRDADWTIRRIGEPLLIGRH